MLDLKSRLCRSYLHSTPNPSFGKGGACCKPMVCHLRCGGMLGIVGIVCIVDMLVTQSMLRQGDVVYGRYLAVTILFAIFVLN